MSVVQTRRRFLTAISLAGAAGLLAGSPALAAEEPLETTVVRLPRIPTTCLAPQYLAEQLLRADGFTDVHYVDAASSAGFTDVVSNGTVDFTQCFVAAVVTGVDSGDAVTGLAPIHVGCLELVASERVRTMADLKGKSVGVGGIGSSDHLFAAVAAAHIGLDPAKDITWVASESPTPEELFGNGKLDAVVGSAPISSGSSCSTAWPCSCQQHLGLSLVAILLLHSVGQSQLRAQASGCDQACGTRLSEGG